MQGNETVRIPAIGALRSGHREVARAQQKTNNANYNLRLYSKAQVKFSAHGAAHASKDSFINNYYIVLIFLYKKFNKL